MNQTQRSLPPASKSIPTHSKNQHPAGSKRPQSHAKQADQSDAKENGGTSQSTHRPTPPTVGSRPGPHSRDPQTLRGQPSDCELLREATEGRRVKEERSAHRIRRRRRRCGGRRRRRIRRGPAPPRAGPPCRPWRAAAPRRWTAPPPWAARAAAAASPSWGGPWEREREREGGRGGEVPSRKRQAGKGPRGAAV